MQTLYRAQKIPTLVRTRLISRGSPHCASWPPLFPTKILHSLKGKFLNFSIFFGSSLPAKATVLNNFVKYEKMFAKNPQSNLTLWLVGENINEKCIFYFISTLSLSFCLFVCTYSQRLKPELVWLSNGSNFRLCLKSKWFCSDFGAVWIPNKIIRMQS